MKYRYNGTTEDLAKGIRIRSLKMVCKSKSSHIGSCLSIADILAVLYGQELAFNPEKPDWIERDRFILSKGHAASILYAVLAEVGFLTTEDLSTYCEDGSLLAGHVNHYVNGIEFSTGSLGHGLSVGCGVALAAKRDKKSFRTYVLLGDGEMDEGSNWEAILFAPQHKLDNLIAIVDYNKLQGLGVISEVINLEPLIDKWQSCGWSAREVNGHDHGELIDTFSSIPLENNKPCVIIAHTKKGKGVSFMEDKLEWHYKSPDSDQLKIALNELNNSG
jgi:transketolase